MEIKINKEIRAYRETLFFGLSMRQFVCSVLAVGVAVTLYFSLSRVLDRETVSWVIMAGKRVWKAENYYEEAMKREVKKH